MCNFYGTLMSQLVPLEQASPHSKDNLCFAKLAKLRRSSPKHSSNCAVFRSFCDVSHMTQLVPPACRGRGAPGQAPHSRDKTDSLINCHHHNHHKPSGTRIIYFAEMKKGEDNIFVLNTLDSVKFLIYMFSISGF